MTIVRVKLFCSVFLSYFDVNCTTQTSTIQVATVAFIRLQQSSASRPNEPASRNVARHDMSQHRFSLRAVQRRDQIRGRLPCLGGRLRVSASAEGAGRGHSEDDSEDDQS